MLTRGQASSANQMKLAKRQRLSKRAKAMPPMSPKHMLPSSRALSKKRSTIVPVVPREEMPAASLSKRPRKAIRMMTPIAEVPIADAPISPDEGGQILDEPQAEHAELISAIRETHRRRQDFHRAEKSLTLQIKAIGRRWASTLALTKELVPDDSNGADHHSPVNHAPYVSSDLSRSEGQILIADHQPHADVALSSEANDEIHSLDDTHPTLDGVVRFATAPLREARALLHKHRIAVERELSKLAMTLPVYATFVVPINGMGALGLGQIVGEAGNLANYSNPAKLWKRMGLAVFNGKSQRKVAGADALEQGYKPARRAVMFCIGDSLLKKANAYKELYDARKQFEIDKARAAGLTIRAKKKGDPKNDDPPGVRTNLCIHRRAQRYAEKRLLLHLWRAWRGHARNVTQAELASPWPAVSEGARE